MTSGGTTKKCSRKDAREMHRGGQRGGTERLRGGEKMKKNGQKPYVDVRHGNEMLTEMDRKWAHGGLKKRLA